MTPFWQRVCLIAVGLAIIVTIGWLRNGDRQNDQHLNWYYDLNSGKLFAPAEPGDFPQDAPSGDLQSAPGTKAGVAALVMSIEGQRTLLYLQTRNPDKAPDLAGRQATIWVCTPPSPLGTAPQWISASTDAGRRIISDAQSLLRDKAWNTDFPAP